MTIKKPYRHTAKIWEYRANVKDSMKRNIPDSKGYSVDFIRYVALSYMDGTDIEVTFGRPNAMGRMITVTAPVTVWELATLEFKSQIK